MFYLRQSTASQALLLGPFVDSTDGNTAETGLTIANTDIRLSVNGGNIVAKNSGGGTHDEIGYYTATFDATDTATVGRLQIMVHVAGALPVYHEAQILEENVFDALFAASAALGTDVAAILVDTGTTLQGELDGIQADTEDIQARLPAALVGGRIDANVGAISADATAADNLEAVLDGTGGVTLVASAITLTTPITANATQISGDATAADNLETVLDDTAGAVRWLGIIDQGTAQAATGTTLQLRSAAAFADDEIIGATILITGGSAGVGQARAITDYVAATDTATVEAWTTTPTGTITYKIFGTAPGSAGGGLDAAGVRAAIGMASANLDTQLSGLDGKLDTIDNFLDTEVAAILADTNELQTDWANGGRLDLIVDAILADTNELQTDWANGGRLDLIIDGILVDTAEIGAAGAGLSAIPWNAAWDAEVQSEATDALNAYDPPTNTEFEARTIASASYATAANLATVDTVVDGIAVQTTAIQAQTDQLSFDAGGGVDANITHVISDPVQEAGATDTNWGGAP